MPNIAEPKFRDWLRDCREHSRPTRDIWDMVVTLTGLAIAIALFFGLRSAEGLQPWVPYTAGTLCAVLYFSSVVHYKTWKSKERKIREFQDRLSPKIEIFIDKETNGIETTRGLNNAIVHYVQVCARSAFDSTVYDCKPHITKIEHRLKPGYEFTEIIAESLLAGWSLQPEHGVTLSAGITHRFNVVWFEETIEKPRHPSGVGLEGTPNKLSDFYDKTGKTGQYRYHVHVAGRDVAPTQGYLTITWLSGALPLVELETLSRGEK
jgi:hypothetical protein